MATKCSLWGKQAIVMANSQQLWVPTWGLQKNGHINSQAWMEKGWGRGLAFIAYTFATDRFRE